MKKFAIYLDGRWFSTILADDAAQAVTDYFWAHPELRGRRLEARELF